MDASPKKLMKLRSTLKIIFLKRKSPNEKTTDLEKMMVTEGTINPEETMRNQEESSTIRNLMVEVPREISEKIKNKKEAREAKLPGLKLVKSNLEMMNLISLLRYISNNIQVVSVDPVGKKARVVLGD